MARHAAVAGDGALRGHVSSVRVLAGGGVSVVVRFKPMDREHAQRLTPQTIVEVVA